MTNTTRHPVRWTWYRLIDGQETVVQTQTTSYTTHNRAFNASQETRYRGETYAYGQVQCECALASFGVTA